QVDQKASDPVHECVSRDAAMMDPRVRGVEGAFTDEEARFPARQGNASAQSHRSSKNPVSPGPSPTPTLIRLRHLDGFAPEPLWVRRREPDAEEEGREPPTLAQRNGAELDRRRARSAD